MLDQLLRFVPPQLHTPYLGLLAHIPNHARNFVVAGEGCAALGHLLKRRSGVHVTGATGQSKAYAIAGELLDGVVDTPDGLSSLPRGGTDAVLFCSLETDAGAVVPWLDAVAPALHNNSLIFALFGSPALGNPSVKQDAAALAVHVSSLLTARGYALYRHWTVGVPESGVLLLATGTQFDPLALSTHLFDSGAYEQAYLVLEQIPDHWTEESSARATVALGKLKILAGWIRHDRGKDTSHLLSRAQDHFYALTDQYPRLQAACECMARCWEYSGNEAMACRLRRSIEFAETMAPPAAERAADRHDSVSLSVPAPAWDPGRPRRILFVIHPRPHFGLDSLYDGLCTCLGDGQVVDFPWKPTLHGGDAETHRNYPCRFRRGGNPMSADEVAAALHNGEFDAVLYGDVEGDLPAADTKAILDARGDCPVFLVDALDQLCNFRSLVQGRLGIDGFHGYFKREMVGSVDYGPAAYPMPFSYAPPAGVPTWGASRTTDFFWAGHRMFGQRRLYLEFLESRYGWNLHASFSQEEYQKRVASSRIGLNCFGMGFDTVRYWELPAHGCLLLSERLPIRVPCDFRDGVEAVFFDDLSDLVDKLDYYLANPDAAETIARAGYAHYMGHHTNEARARQLLGWIQAALDPAGSRFG